MVDQPDWKRKVSQKEATPYITAIGEVVLNAALLETLVSELLAWMYMKNASPSSLSIFYHIGFAAKCEIIKNLCKADGHESLVDLRKIIERAEKFNGFRNAVVHGGTVISPSGVQIVPMATAKQYSKKPIQPITLKYMREQLSGVMAIADDLEQYVDSFRAASRPKKKKRHQEPEASEA